MYDKRRRTRAFVDVDDVIVRADNIIIVGDDRRRRRGDVLGAEDRPRRRDRYDDGFVAGAQDRRDYHY